ncbi:S-layer homology domain-containing protein [Brevibacillus fulvus]|uniref:SLH domain-containing protein n=1 Tax=Brevibacillus fulvus TaxID=1125967 RepID=A0A938Y2Q3_9BACL|nr:S-layer homology domain-containing protein [Brevibacillus fulvus]MBM7590562.1 hypothetical protein [Brevibacillus fulvus]
MKHFRLLIALSGIALFSLTNVQTSSAMTLPAFHLSQVVSAGLSQAVMAIDKQSVKPDAPLTAAQGIQLIVEAFALNLDEVRFLKAPLATDYFPRAKNDAWYANTLIIAAHNGFDLPRQLDPNQTWTKEKFLHQLMHVLEQHEHLPMIRIAPESFADMDQLEPLYQGSIERAIALKIVKLDAERKLHPKAEITRSEALEWIGNAVAFSKKRSSLAGSESDQ